MPRQLRVEYPGALYHVMSRGDRQKDIYVDDVDRQDFLNKSLHHDPRRKRSLDFQEGDPVDWCTTMSREKGERKQMPWLERRGDWGRNTVPVPIISLAEKPLTGEPDAGGKPASPVRREGWRSIRHPYPY